MCVHVYLYMYVHVHLYMHVRVHVARMAAKCVGADWESNHGQLMGTPQL